MSELGVHRRLAAILAADVVGYSRLMGEDETGTLAALRANREELIEPKVAAHEGRIVKLMGDGVLAEFPSALEAVRCAVEVQRAMAERNADVPEARQVRFRIGVNLGDVISEGDDIYGDGINVAARLEEMAEPGGICLSSMVRVQIQNKIDVGLQDLGEKELKNIAYPVHVFSVLLDGEETPITKRVKQRHRVTFGQLAGSVFAVLVLVAGGVTLWLKPWAPDVEPVSVERMAFPLPDKPSIAVLAFENLSGDPEQEPLSDAISEGIITELSRFPELFVIARNSSFTYKGKPVKVQQVSEELGIRYVVEGSFQKTNDNVRITAQLIDATRGEHLWAERYDRQMEGMFQIQDEITRTIVVTVAEKVDISERERAMRKHPANLAAFEYLLRGEKLWLEWTKEGNQQARQMYEKAVELDPQFARGYSYLAWVYINGFRWGWTDISRDESLVRAREFALKALALSPFDYDAHWTMANVYMQGGKQDQALTEYARALELNPNAADVLADGAEPLVYLGRAEEAVAQLKQAMRLNPYHPDWYWWSLGWAQYFAEGYEDAVASINRMPDIPNGARRILAAALVRLGRLDEAKAVMAEFIENGVDMTLSDLRNSKLFQSREYLDRWLEDLRAAGMPE